MTSGVKKILYVEDEKDIREVVTLMCRSEGYEVSAVETGLAALELASCQKFDLYIMDNGLPDIRGVDLCKKLREINPTPTLFYSAASDKSDLETAFSSGAQAYVVKPASVEKLINEVRRLINPGVSDPVC